MVAELSSRTNIHMLKIIGAGRFTRSFVGIYHRDIVIRTKLEKCCAVGAPERPVTDVYMCGYKVLLLARLNLIWIVKCMCLRCRLLKYVYGSSMRS